MRPTVEARLGFEDQASKNPDSGRIAKRYEIARFRLSVSRRDSRTQPGVLTPGTDPKNAPPQRGGRVDISRIANSLYLQRPVCRPFSTANPLRGCNSDGEHCFFEQRRFGSAKARAHQRGGLASNPPAQWCLVVAKPDLQHGIRRCDQFSGGRNSPLRIQDPVCENA